MLFSCLAMIGFLVLVKWDALWKEKIGFFMTWKEYVLSFCICRFSLG